MIKFPDYENSILSVTSSILKYYGAECGHKSLKVLDEKLTQEYKNVVLMLFDGMGAKSLETALSERSFLRQHLECPISSVFPPTTVAATTSVQSGLSPAEHGRLGWYLYFKEAHDNVAVFSNIKQSDGKSAGKVSLADTYLPYVDICDKIKAAADVEADTVSPFSEYKCRTMRSIFTTAGKILNKDGRHFIYCYWPQPDKDMHICGVNSLKAKMDIRRINHLAKKFCSKLSDTLVVIIADHGLIDTKWLRIEDYPKLSGMLEKKPSIERRAAALFVKDGMQGEFEKEFKNIFGDKFLLLNKNEIIDSKLFGEGRINERIDDFTGDFIAISTGDWALELQKGDTLMKGCHAGLTEQEMLVPLIIADSKCQANL